MTVPSSYGPATTVTPQVYRNRTDRRDTPEVFVRRILLPLLTLLLLVPPAFGADNWPQFRGPTQQGHSDVTGLPVRWSETQNVKFKTLIPGEGWSSPVVWGRQVWMTTAADGGH